MGVCIIHNWENWDIFLKVSVEALKTISSNSSDFQFVKINLILVS